MTQIQKSGFQRVAQPETALSGVGKIVLLGDPGCTLFSSDSQRILDEILSQKADLFFILGDLAFSDSEEEFRDLIAFCDARVHAPIFATRGNHDLAHYAGFLGRSSYALVLDPFVCFFLDNATGHFLPEDLDLLRSMLEKHHAKSFILLMHIPPPHREAHRHGVRKKDWDELRAVLDSFQDRIKHIFCAHIHGFHQYDTDGYPVTITAGGGAAMIHEVMASAQKLYHSVALSLHQDGSFGMEVVPAGISQNRVIGRE